MTPDEIDDCLRRIFPGDPIPDITEDTYWSDESPVSWRVSAPPTQVESKRSKVGAPVGVPSRELAAKFQRVLDGLPPSPSVPTRAYLIENPENLTRWLNEAHDIEADVKLAIGVSPQQVTRLLLEAIPVVQKFAKT